MERTLRLTLLVYEPSEIDRGVIRAAIKAFAAHRDVDLRIDWMSHAEQEKRIPQILSDTLIALVNAGMGERSAIAGRLIYDTNPDCLLVYYGERQRDLTPLLSARPVAYNPEPGSAEAWYKILDELTDRVVTGGRYFQWSGKDRRYCLPYRSITHISSERTYLNIFTVSGAAYRMIGKLDEAAKQLPRPLFLRIHQSELVNTSYVRVMDRSRRCLVLEDGAELYISRAHYGEVLEWAEKR